jgi:hypothetical protein
MIQGMATPAWKSARKAEILITNRMEFFFIEDQLSGSFGSSDGWGTRTV